jgi:hypothetical protein
MLTVQITVLILQVLISVQATVLRLHVLIYVQGNILSWHVSLLPVQVPAFSFKFASALAILVSTLNILALLSWCGGELSLKVSKRLKYTSSCVEQTTNQRYSKSKFGQNTTNLLSIEVATCFDSRSHHQANYWTTYEVRQRFQNVYNSKRTWVQPRSLTASHPKLHTKRSSIQSDIHQMYWYN